MFDREMQAALEADGAKLRQLTSDDHGPYFDRPIVATQQAGFAPWMAAIGPTDSEPDYDAYIAELDSLEESMANVDSYDDYFVEQS